jgi:hypothetical protein
MKKSLKNTKLKYSTQQRSLFKKNQKDVTFLKDDLIGVIDPSPRDAATGRNKLFRDEINFQLDLLSSSLSQPNLQLSTAQCLFHFLISNLDDESEDVNYVFVPDSLIVAKIVQIFESLSEKRRNDINSYGQPFALNDAESVFSIYRMMLLIVLLMMSNYMLVKSKRSSHPLSNNSGDRRKCTADDSIFSFGLFQSIAHFPVSTSNCSGEVVYSSFPQLFVEPKLNILSCYSSPAKPGRKEEPSSVSGGKSFRSKRKFGSNASSNNNSNSNSVASSPSLFQTALINTHNEVGHKASQDVYTSSPERSLSTTPFVSPSKSMRKISSSVIDTKPVAEIWPELYIALSGGVAEKEEPSGGCGMIEEACQLSIVFLTAFMRVIIEEVSSSLTFSTTPRSDMVPDVADQEAADVESLNNGTTGLQVEEWKSLLFQVQACLFSAISPVSTISSSSRPVGAHYTFTSLNTGNKRNPLLSSSSSVGTLVNTLFPYYFSSIVVSQVNEILACLSSKNRNSAKSVSSRISEMSLSLQRSLECIEMSCHNNVNNQVSVFLSGAEFVDFVFVSLS